MTPDVLKKSLGSITDSADGRLSVQDNVDLTIYASLGQLTLTIDKVASVVFNDLFAQIVTRDGEYVVGFDDIRAFHSQRRDRTVGYA